MGETYQAVIIGAGHNGLVLGNYLVRAGLKTVILERRMEIGGGLSSEEITIPGFIHNLHSYFHDTINIMPPYLDLELEKYNARYRRPPVQAGLPLSNGQSVCMYADPERTRESLSRLSRRDADAFVQMSENYKDYMEAVVAPALFSPPQYPSAQPSLLESSPEGLEFLRLGRLSPMEVLDEHFENPHIKALLLHQLPIPRGILPDYAGLGSVIPLVVSQVEQSQICLGGSHVLAHALWRSFLAHGGLTLGLSHVSRILVEDGRAVGVELAGGDRIMAEKVVVSAVDLKQTFLDMIEPSHLTTEFIDRVRGFLLDEFSVFAVHLALKEPPNHCVDAGEPDIDQAFKLNIGLETPEDYIRMFARVRADRLPDKMGMFGSVPTLFDPTQAPRGHHTAFMWQPAPFRPDGGDPSDWEDIKDDFMEACINRWREYAPNLNSDNILAKVALTPLDMERKLINMRAGGIFMGRMNLGQIEYFRPLPELAEFKTPIDQLYLCGACCHPGGGIIGGSGLIAAEMIAEDLGLDKWWS